MDTLLISRRDGENNGLLAGVPLLPRPSRVVSRPNSLSLPFQTPATQASHHRPADLQKWSKDHNFFISSCLQGTFFNTNALSKSDTLIIILMKLLVLNN